MMQRITENRPFFDLLFSTESNIKQKRILKSENYENLCSVFELIFNATKFTYTKKEEKILSKHRVILKKFFKKKWQIPEFKEFILKGWKKIEPIICLVLQKISKNTVSNTLCDND